MTHTKTQRRRFLKDALAQHIVRFGGLAVIFAIVLIFFYLLYVVTPLFDSIETSETARYSLPMVEQGDTLHLAMDEYAEVGARFTNQGHVIFFDLHSGEIIENIELNIPSNVSITSFADSMPAQGIVALGLSNGTALVVQHHYKAEHGENSRTITPEVLYPMGEEPIELDPDGDSIIALNVQSNEEESSIISASDRGKVTLTSFIKEVSFLDDSVTFEAETFDLPPIPLTPDYVLMDQGQRKLYIASKAGELIYIDISDKDEIQIIQRLRVVEKGTTLSSIKFLTGSISLLIGDSTGAIYQWFPVHDARGSDVLQRIRGFNQNNSPISAIATEHYRKGFLAADNLGQIGIYYTTAERTLTIEKISPNPLQQLAVSPRADALLAEDNQGQLFLWSIVNEHPEISWSSLWGKVWYESYDEPTYLWQSSSASNDFEPKFSLIPISFGTLKAAFYAMLLAVPLSILGAIFTAHFMAPRMRRVVKPSIEIMEALPTVILGFLAGLWLAPLIEKNMPGLFSLLIVAPVAIIFCAFMWGQLPKNIRNRVPDGWEAALLIPVIIIVAWFSMALSTPLEEMFFNGDLRKWLTNDMGIDFDQRNAVIVGLAMGFAVIPTIFSIAEDAIFAVPKHLTNGSLALGATPWQTLSRVILLTASPGIFSGVMIGMGRAVGETMIVLMATGNTPIMDLNIFEGMRTLSANIAVEMPEAEVHSTHFRVLFLAALVLFTFTFIFNTVGEVVRQRLRKKYSSL